MIWRKVLTGGPKRKQSTIVSLSPPKSVKYGCQCTHIINFDITDPLTRTHSTESSRSHEDDCDIILAISDSNTDSSETPLSGSHRGVDKENSTPKLSDHRKKQRSAEKDYSMRKLMVG